jgi:hypothetical protein
MADLVALQTMLPQISSPFDQQGKALQLRQMMNAGQQADFEAQQRQQAQADDQSYRAAMQANPTGGAGLLSALAGSGNYKGYAQAQKQDLDQRKGNADVAHLGAQTQQANMTALNQAFTLHRDQINTVTDPQSAAQWVAAAYKDPTLGPLVSQSGPVEDAIARIPTDPAKFAQWKLQAGTNADEYVKHTTVDANTAANNATSVKTAGISAAASKYSADTNARTASNRLAFDTEQAKNGDDATMDPLAVRMTAQQYLAGDRGALNNFGRGAQGAQNLNAVRLEISKQATAAGLSGADIAAKMAEFDGLKAGQRTAGVRSASIEIAANEVNQLAPIALDASSKVVRSGFLPFGKAQIMFDSNTNDPNLRQFAMANTALVNAYGQAMARGGAATVSDKEHARELLSTSFDQPSYAAAVAQLQKETKAAQAAPKQVRKDLSEAVSGRDGAAAIPDGWSVKEH